VSVLVSVGFSFSFAGMGCAARIQSNRSGVNTGVFVVVACRCVVLCDAQNGLKRRCCARALPRNICLWAGESMNFSVADSSRYGRRGSGDFGQPDGESCVPTSIAIRTLV
jgi:hypothetical protein